MTTHLILLSLHLIGAAIWTGGHLILALRVLPRALREKDARRVADFEKAFEPVGLPALLVQVVTGLMLAFQYSDSPAQWVELAPGFSRAIGLKLILLFVTIGLALHARLVLIPRLTDERLGPLAWHIGLVTITSVAFVVIGTTFRIGGMS